MHAAIGSTIALFIFALAAWAAPEGNPGEYAGLYLTLSTLLFALISGFFLSKLYNRYHRIRELIATEDAYWLALYETSTLFGKRFSKKMADHIDKYYISAFDYHVAHSYYPGIEHIHEVYKLLAIIPKGKAKQIEQAYDEMVVFLSVIEESRYKASMLAKERLHPFHWILMSIFGGLTIGSLFALYVPMLHTQVITVLLSTSIVTLLLTLRDLELLRVGGKMVLVESGQEIFEVMGRDRYYHQHHLKAKTAAIPGHVTQYRLGHHNPGEKPKVKVVSVK